MSREDTLARLRAYAAANTADVQTVTYTVRDMAELEAYRALALLSTTWRKKLPTAARRRVLLSLGVDLLEGAEREQAERGLSAARARNRERMRETLEEALRRTLAAPRKRQQRWMSSGAAARTIPGMPAPAFDHEPFPLVNRWPLRRCERHPEG